MAGAGLAATAAAQLPGRDARPVLHLRRAGIRRPRTLSHVACARDATRDAGGAAVDAFAEDDIARKRDVAVTPAYDESRPRVSAPRPWSFPASTAWVVAACRGARGAARNSRAPRRSSCRARRRTRRPVRPGCDDRWRCCGRAHAATVPR